MGTHPTGIRQLIEAMAQKPSLCHQAPREMIITDECIGVRCSQCRDDYLLVRDPVSKKYGLQVKNANKKESPKSF